MLPMSVVLLGTISPGEVAESESNFNYIYI